MDDELKPCPFCGGEAELVETPSGLPAYKLWCKNPDCFAGAVEVKHFRRETLVAAWNRRVAQQPDTPDMVRALDDAYEAGRKSMERTCDVEIEYRGDLILTRYLCCGYELKEYKYSPYPEVAFNYCPNCGAKVVE